MTVIRVVGIKELREGLDAREKRQVPFALALALTRTAERARGAIEAQMKGMHQPTRFFLRSLWLKPATKKMGDRWSMIYLKDGRGTRVYDFGGTPFTAAGIDMTRHFGHLYSGGARQQKRFEWLLETAGLMPSGHAAVPGKGLTDAGFAKVAGKALRLDANGNIPRALIQQLLSYFAAYKDAAQAMNKTRRKKLERKIGEQSGAKGGIRFFVSRGKGHWVGNGGPWKEGRAQDLPAGIWAAIPAGDSQRPSATRVSPIILFVKRGTYRHYFDLPGAARAAMAQHFATEYEKAFALAMRTEGRLADGATRAQRAADFARRANVP